MELVCKVSVCTIGTYKKKGEGAMHLVPYLYVQILVGIVECLCKFYQIECSPFGNALLYYIRS